MNKELSSFVARLRGTIANRQSATGHQQFSELAHELFALQFDANPAYRRICEARQLTPQTIEHWTQVPFVPTSAFKELELSCIPADERTAVFHSSGTTGQKPSRHFHSAESLAVYEASLWQWFKSHVGIENEFVSLTPDQLVAPCSSLVHMFETIRRHISSGVISPTRGNNFSLSPGEFQHPNVNVYRCSEPERGLSQSAARGQRVGLRIYSTTCSCRGYCQAELLLGMRQFALQKQIRTLITTSPRTAHFALSIESVQ